jgi:hypothetical protein
VASWAIAGSSVWSSTNAGSVGCSGTAIGSKGL